MKTHSKTSPPVLFIYFFLKTVFVVRKRVYSGFKSWYGTWKDKKKEREGIKLSRERAR